MLEDGLVGLHAVQVLPHAVLALASVHNGTTGTDPTSQVDASCTVVDSLKNAPDERVGGQEEGSGQRAGPLHEVLEGLGVRLQAVEDVHPCLLDERWSVGSAHWLRALIWFKCIAGQTRTEEGRDGGGRGEGGGEHGEQERGAEDAVAVQVHVDGEDLLGGLHLYWVLYVGIGR